MDTTEQAAPAAPYTPRKTADPHRRVADPGRLDAHDADHGPADGGGADELGAPVDLWDTAWPQGRYYWTVVPVSHLAGKTLTLALSGPALSGDRTVTVAGSGLAVGDQVTIGVTPSQDRATIVALTETSVTLSSPLTFAHGPGEAVVRAAGVDRVPRRRARPGGVRSGAGRHLRQDERAGRDRGRRSLRIRALHEGPPRRCRLAPRHLLRDAARGLGAGARRDRVRGAVEQDALPVPSGRRAGVDVCDRGRRCRCGPGRGSTACAGSTTRCRPPAPSRCPGRTRSSCGSRSRRSASSAQKSR